MNAQAIIATRKWIETAVIGLNLCPFAKKEFDDDRIRFVDSDANNPSELLKSLQAELTYLQANDQTETTLLIHRNTLQNFDDYNQFLAIADQLLCELQLDGVFQIASFHPIYQFANTQADDVENYTNRSPYPMLHIIREASLSKAIERHSNPEAIPERNITLLRTLGEQKLVTLLKTCFKSHTLLHAIFDWMLAAYIKPAINLGTRNYHFKKLDPFLLF